MMNAVKIEGLGELLEHLKDEVNHWALEGENPNTRIVTEAEAAHVETQGAPLILDNTQAQADAQDKADRRAAGVPDAQLIRYGLYLTAMDILLAEMYPPGGYESYSRLPDRLILPENDYQPLRKALDPYVRWFKNLLFQHATALSQAGLAEHDAFRQAVIRGTETLTELASARAAG